MKHVLVFCALLYFKCSAPLLGCSCTFNRLLDCFEDISRPLHCLPITTGILHLSWIGSGSSCTFTAVLNATPDHWNFILCQYRVLHWNYCLIRVLHNHYISITSCAILPKTLFSLNYLPLSVHINISVCIYTLLDYTIFHFIWGIAFYMFHTGLLLIFICLRFSCKCDLAPGIYKCFSSLPIWIIPYILNANLELHPYHSL